MRLVVKFLEEYILKIVAVDTEVDGFPPPRTLCLAAGITALPTALRSSRYTNLLPLSLLAFKDPDVSVIAQPNYGTVRDIHTTVNRRAQVVCHCFV